jgi:endonuclease/exonuclease/phosphatase family metal-dependent hydrolase
MSVIPAATIGSPGALSVPPRPVRPRQWNVVVLLVAMLLGACARRATIAPNGDQSLRVMTYNIQSGHGSIDGTAAAIRAQSPDIVALQEVDVHWAERSAFADQATILGERLGMQVRFARIYRIPNGDQPPREFGVALLSRFPIVAFRNDTLTRLSTQETTPVPAPAPGLLEARLDVRGTQVRVFNTHLDYRANPAVRRQQVAEMVRYIGSTASPTLVFGDLNATPDAGELQPLLAALRDTWPAGAGPGLTYPADKPEKRIDYVLVSPHFSVRSAAVPVTEASDHRPVVVDLVCCGGR